MKSEGDVPENDWSSVALDWLDLLLILAAAYGIVLLCLVLELPLPRASWMGVVLAPVVLAGLGLRRKIWPSRRGRVKSKFSLLGLLATCLLIGGFSSAALGVYIWTNSLQDKPALVTEEEVEAEAYQRAQLHPLLDLAKALGEAVDIPADEVPTEQVGGIEDLEALLDAPPEVTDVNRHMAEVREELEARNQAWFEERRENARSSVTKLALVGLGFLLLGAFFDSRRARLESPAERLTS